MKNTDIPVSMGLINFINCLPINYALAKFAPENIIFSRGNPALMNELLRNGQVMIAPISSIEYLLNEEDYVLMKENCISSYGECGSVILFSRRKLEELKGKNIAVPYNSASSTAMLKVLLKSKGMPPEEINFSVHRYKTPIREKLKEVDAVLYIGDNALIARYKNENTPDFYQYDLGTLWTDFTELPAVFAAGAARADMAINRQDDFNRIKTLIGKAVEAGTGIYFNEVIKEATQDFNLNDDYIKDYLSSKIKYDFTSEHEKSLNLFKELYLKL